MEVVRFPERHYFLENLTKILSISIEEVPAVLVGKLI